MFEGLLQPQHLLLILAVAVIFFGPKKLPELGKGIGEGIKALKEGLRDEKSATAAGEKSNDPTSKS